MDNKTASPYNRRCLLVKSKLAWYGGSREPAAQTWQLGRSGWAGSRLHCFLVTSPGFAYCLGPEVLGS
ncbi:hypothetical protein JMJ77_0001299, partial [Colletotrichum scovillei]